MSGEAPARPGPVAWVAIAAGWAVMGWAVLGVLREAERSHPGSWATWVVGLAVVHDGLVLPAVALGGGWLVGRAPGPWRAPARVALVTAAVVTLVSVPVVVRFGARADNPSLLPLPAGRNLLMVLAVAALAGLLGGYVSARRARRRSPTEGRSDGEGDPG